MVSGYPKLLQLAYTGGADSHSGGDEDITPIEMCCTHNSCPIAADIGAVLSFNMHFTYEPYLTNRPGEESKL